MKNEGNATWAETKADGQVVFGNCISGYYGTTSRVCIQSGSTTTTTWSPIFNFCYRTLPIFFSFERNKLKRIIIIII